MRNFSILSLRRVTAYKFDFYVTAVIKYNGNYKFQERVVFVELIGNPLVAIAGIEAQNLGYTRKISISFVRTPPSSPFTTGIVPTSGIVTSNSVTTSQRNISLTSTSTTSLLQSSTTNETKDSKLITITAILVGGIVLISIAILAFLIALKRKFRRERAMSMQENEKEDFEMQLSMHATSASSIRTVIGSGSFGIVYK